MATVGDIYEVRFVCELPPQISVNVWHMRVSAVTGAGANDQAIADSIDTRMSMAFKGLLSDDAVYRGVGSKKISPAPLGVEFVGNLGAGAGTNIGVPLPKQITGLITKRTLFPGGQGRGRMYVPFPNEENSEAPGVPTVAYRNLMATLANLFVGNQTAGPIGNQVTFVYGVYSRVSSTFSDITGGIVRAKWATQRRRGDYGRSNVAPF